MLFRGIEVAIRDARVAEIPVFAPAHFKKVLKYYEAAETSQRDDAPAAEIEEQIRKTEAALQQAVVAARLPREVASEAYTARKRGLRRGLLNEKSKEFKQADQDLHAAIHSAEANDLDTARKQASRAARAYRQAVLRHLERGPISDAAARLDAARPFLDRAQAARAAQEIDDLRNALTLAGDLGFDVVVFADDIIARINNVFLPIYPAFYRSPPDTLLIGGFTLKVESYEHRSWDFTRNVITSASGVAWTSFNCDAPTDYPFIDLGLQLTPRKFRVVEVVKRPASEIGLDEARKIDSAAETGTAIEFNIPRDMKFAEPLLASLLAKKLEIREDLLHVLLGKKKKGMIKVAFENLTIEPTTQLGVGRVLEGIASYPTTPPVPHRITLTIAGFTVYLDSLRLTPTTATAEAELELPSTIVDPSACRAARIPLGEITIDAACRFHQELPEDSFGTWVLDETGMMIAGTGVIADFSTSWKWPGWVEPPPLAPSWRGVILQSGVANTIGVANVVSNTGYLSAPYVFSNGLVSAAGLTADFTLSADFTFGALEPFGYDITLRSGKLVMQNNAIYHGLFHNGKIVLPKTAAVDRSGDPVEAGYGALYVQADLDLYAETTIMQELHWGEFMQTAPSLRAYSIEHANKSYFYLSGKHIDPYLPLAGGGFTNPGFATSPWMYLESHGMQGATLLEFRWFTAHTPDTPGPVSIRFQTDQGRSWLNVGNGGVHGRVVLQEVEADPELGPTQHSQYVASVPFDTMLFATGEKQRFDIGNLQFVDSAVYHSEVSGSIKLGGPTKATIPFRALQFTSTAHIAGAEIDLSIPIKLDYWGVDLVQRPGASSAGVLSVKTGQIFLTAAGLDEPRHFSEPFFLTWGEILASGDLGRLFFDYNSVGQEFDGFPFVANAIGLSRYDAAAPDPDPYLQAGGTAHFDFFGPDYLNIHDIKDSDPNPPFDGRRIKLASDTDHGALPTDTSIARDWSGDLGDLDFNIAYDDADQDGFIGAGTMQLAMVSDGSLAASIFLTSDLICMSIAETNRRDITLGPVAHFGTMSRITGCACIEDRQLKRLSASAELESSVNANVLLRSAAYGKLEIMITPTVSEWRVEGDMYLSVVAGGDLEVKGSARFTVDRVENFVEGELEGRVSSYSMFSGLEAEGKLNWHLGAFGGDSYQSIQGRLAVFVFSPVGGSSAEGGFYLGINAPKTEAWVLQDEDSRFKLNMASLPDRLTGVYGYVNAEESLNLWVVSGGIEIYAGLGAFVTAFPGTESSGLTVLPFVVGNMGVRIWGEILGGLVSAAASAQFSIIAPYPFLFEGTVGLEGCIVWVLCASVDLTCGLNSTERFYIR